MVSTQRQMGFGGAVGVGVGAIVGGGILALAGAAFAATGPSAILAFTANGVIALLTALSFAEVASKFPESGGTYTFSKKVLSVEAAFVVGWVVWFASIVAAALYAIGFAEFARIAVVEATGWFGVEAAWQTSQAFVVGMAIAAIAAYMLLLLFRSAGGGALINIGKVVVFGFLIGAGFWALRERSSEAIQQSLDPFFAESWPGLLRAMGFSFIALQGFDLIAAVGGEIRKPEQTIPRAMLISLVIALAIYLPLLFVIATAALQPDESITELSRQHGEQIIAIVAQSYLGRFGYWLVVVAAILSMLSALQANLFAASRVAVAMAHDRTLPRRLSRVSRRTQSPKSAIIVTGLLIIGVLVVVPDVAAAGAAASLIFLITFALAHWIAILVRQRSGQRPPPFRVPMFPLVPIAGGAACLALAIYQGIAVPKAGYITTVWLSLGGLLFLGLFARRARVADASNTALDPELVQLRGMSPLVLVPLANPDTARGLVAVANALAPPAVGRVLLLSVVVARRDWHPDLDPGPLEKTHLVLREALGASVAAGHYPEALATIAEQPWDEISRVARAHHCESLLVGLSEIHEDVAETPIDRLMNQVDCDIVVLRAPKGWQLSQVNRILIPVAGRGGHDVLLARLLGSLSRESQPAITLLRVVAEKLPPNDRQQIEREMRRMALDLGVREPSIQVVAGGGPADCIVEHAAANDLLVMGVQRAGRRRKMFGEFIMQVAQRTETPLLLISGRG